MITVEHLSRSFGNVLALDDVSFKVAPGVTGLLGPNGAGKTTLLRCIVTVLAPDSGRVRVAGHDVGPPASRRHARRVLGYMPQELAFYPRFTVRRYLDHVAILKEIEPKKARDYAIGMAAKTVGLVDRLDTQIRTLSGGMRRRLGIAQTFLGDPAVIVLDEPTAGLDPQQRIAFRSTVSDLVDDCRVVLLSTHQTEDVAAICDRVIVIHEGRVRYQGTADGLAEVAAGKVWLSDQPPAHGAGWRTASGKYRVLGSRPDGVESLKPTLEDGYLWLLNGQAGD